MIKSLFKVLFGVAVLAVVLVFAGGYWIQNNADTVAEAALDASGVNDDMAKRRAMQCDAAQRQFQSAWDRAVESGTDEQQSDMLASMEAQADIACSDA